MQPTDEDAWEKLQQSVLAVSMEAVPTSERPVLTCAKCRVRQFEPQPIGHIIPIWCPKCRGVSN